MLVFFTDFVDTYCAFNVIIRIGCLNTPLDMGKEEAIVMENISIALSVIGIVFVVLVVLFIAVKVFSLVVGKVESTVSTAANTTEG